MSDNLWKVERINKRRKRQGKIEWEKSMRKRETPTVWKHVEPNQIKTSHECGAKNVKLSTKSWHKVNNT